MVMDRVGLRRWARWTGGFIGFPLAGVAARLVAGDIGSAGAAVLGGVVGGAVLGTVQAVIGGMARVDRVRWVLATALGLGVGLGVGAAAVGFETDTASLVTMGALSGSGVGVAQAMALRARVADRLAWASVTPVLWALGWLMTSQVIVDADRRHAIFGSSGALAVSLLAGLVRMAARPATPHLTPASLNGTSVGSAVAR